MTKNEKPFSKKAELVELLLSSLFVCTSVVKMKTDWPPSTATLVDQIIRSRVHVRELHET